MSWRRGTNSQAAYRSFQRIELASRQVAPLVHDNVQHETFRILRPSTITMRLVFELLGHFGTDTPFLI